MTTIFLRLVSTVLASCSTTACSRSSYPTSNATFYVLETTVLRFLVLPQLNSPATASMTYHVGLVVDTDVGSAVTTSGVEKRNNTNAECSGGVGVVQGM